MAAYDNVSLPGAPDIAHAGNYAQMLMQGLQAIPDKYYKYKDQQYQQQQRDLFQDPNNQAMLQRALDPNNQDPNKYAPVLQAIIKSQGASAGPVIGQLMSDEAGARLAKSISGDGGTPQQPNTSPTAQTAAALDKASTQTGGAPTYPRIPYAGASEGSLSAGADNGQSVRTLTAGIGGSNRDVPGPVMDRLARSLGLPDADATIPEGQSDLARQRISAYLQRNGGVSQSPLPATNDAASGGAPPINAASANQGNEPPAVGAGGGQAISPAPTAAAGAIQPSGPQVAQAPIGDRFGAAYGNPPGVRPTPVGTEAQAREAETRAKNMRAMQAYYAGRNKNAAEAIGARAAEEEKRAHEIRDSIGKYNEPTSEEKNVQSGAAERAEQIKSDAKYYDSLHRGLVGSGMIAAQQKQNVDILRQVASSPNFIPGAGSDLALSYQRLAAQFGINPTGAAPREIFNQVSARILADQFSGMKSMSAETGETGGRLFKSMLDIEEKANITADDSLAGIKAKLDIIDKTGDLMMRWADLASDYKIKHGKLDAGFDKELRADIAKGRVPNVVPKAGPPLKAGRYKWTPEGGIQGTQ